MQLNRFDKYDAKPVHAIAYVDILSITVNIVN